MLNKISHHRLLLVLQVTKTEHWFHLNSLSQNGIPEHNIYYKYRAATATTTITSITVITTITPTQPPQQETVHMNFQGPEIKSRKTRNHINKELGHRTHINTHNHTRQNGNRHGQTITHKCQNTRISVKKVFVINEKMWIPLTILKWNINMYSACIYHIQNTYQTHPKYTEYISTVLCSCAILLKFCELWQYKNYYRWHVLYTHTKLCCSYVWCIQ